jgi:hypothetical protein
MARKTSVCAPGKSVRTYVDENRSTRVSDEPSCSFTQEICSRNFAEWRGFFAPSATHRRVTPDPSGDGVKNPIARNREHRWWAMGIDWWAGPAEGNVSPSGDSSARPRALQARRDHAVKAEPEGAVVRRTGARSDAGRTAPSSLVRAIQPPTSAELWERVRMEHEREPGGS